LNQLTELPQSIIQLKELTKLSISANKFVSFPRVITQLLALTEVYI